MDSSQPIEPLGQWNAFAPLSSQLQCETAFAGTSDDWRSYLDHRRDWFTSGSAPRSQHTTSGAGGTVLLRESADPARDDTRLIDLSSQTLNCILGLNDPWVKLRQVQFLLSPHPHFVTIRIGFDLFHRYAQRLLALLNTPLAAASGRHYSINHRSCNGSDAVELAVQVAASAAAARAAPSKRKSLISFRGSYHGQNLTAALISDHQPVNFLVERAHSNVELFDVPVTEDDEASGAVLAALGKRGGDFFAVVIEPIQARNAVHVVPPGFLRKLCHACREAGVCLIFDEIQTGFGYCGGVTYAETINVWPDIFAFSKAVTSGHGALGLTVVDSPYKEFVDGTFCGKTNSADVLALVAADAVLDRLFGGVVGDDPRYQAALSLCPSPQLLSELEAGLLSARYAALTTSLDDLLSRLILRFPTLLATVAPGAGLLRGLTLLGRDGRPSTALCAWVCAQGLKHGVYVRQAEHTITIKPCLTLTMVELRAAEEGLVDTFEAAERQRGAL